MYRAEWWELADLLWVALLVPQLFTIMLFHFSPRTPVSSASCHGDTVGLHTMRLGTLQQVWLRKTHYLTQPFWLMMKICERSCHATGQTILAQEKIWAGLRSIVGSGRQARENKEAGGRSGLSYEGEKEERYWKRFGWEWRRSVEKTAAGGKITSGEEEKKKEANHLFDGMIWQAQYWRHFLPQAEPHIERPRSTFKCMRDQQFADAESDARAKCQSEKTISILIVTADSGEKGAGAVSCLSPRSANSRIYE